MSSRDVAGTALLKPVYLAVFLDMVAFAIILPALPFYAMNLGGAALWLGVLLTSYSAAKLIGAALAGRLSDQEILLRVRVPVDHQGVEPQSASAGLAQHDSL